MPKTRVDIDVTLPDLAPLTANSFACLRRFAEYTPPREPQWPRSRRAAVMIALFVGRQGDLYVLLSQRSSSLRTYAGDTSLPGGRMDSTDESIEFTARREAFEEIGLPFDPEVVRRLCTLPPHLTGNFLVVTPVVCLVTERAIQPMLNAAEVESLFSHPLEAFLFRQPQGVLLRYLAPSDPYHTFTDIPDPDPVAVLEDDPRQRKQHRLRIHRFENGRKDVKPIVGFTARVLLRAAAIGYGREPDFGVDAHDSLSEAERLLRALRVPTMRRAMEQEMIEDGAEQGGRRTHRL